MPSRSFPFRCSRRCVVVVADQYELDRVERASAGNPSPCGGLVGMARLLRSLKKQARKWSADRPPFAERWRMKSSRLLPGNMMCREFLPFEDWPGARHLLTDERKRGGRSTEVIRGSLDHMRGVLARPDPNGGAGDVRPALGFNSLEETEISAEAAVWRGRASSPMARATACLGSFHRWKIVQEISSIYDDNAPPCKPR